MIYRKRPVHFRRPLKSRHAKPRVYTYDGNPNNVVYDEDYFFRLAKKLTDESFARFRKKLEEFEIK